MHILHITRGATDLDDDVDGNAVESDKGGIYIRMNVYIYRYRYR